jgi:DNA-directed RNA polymerase specialized sigma24 family protein
VANSRTAVWKTPAPQADSLSGYASFAGSGLAGSSPQNAMDLSKNAPTETSLTETSLTEPAIERLRLKLRYKVLYHLGHGCADVDDLVQESLARFFRAEQRHLIRNTDELGAFLNGVCRNVILEYRRRIRREPPVDPDVPIPEIGVRPATEIFEMRDAIDNGLQELAERAILRSLYLEGREKDDICGEWGLSDAQFRVVLFRAKERFRRVYNMELKRNSAGNH